MRTKVDLSQLAVTRHAPAALPGPSVVRRRSLLTRFVLPGLLLAGFAGLVAYAARETLSPPQVVTVIPVTSSQAVMDARSVCNKLGIPYYLVDEAAEFQRRVIGYFAEEYKAGRTPNPCVMCNQHLKFGTLLDRARRTPRAPTRASPPSPPCCPGPRYVAEGSVGTSSPSRSPAPTAAPRSA